MPCSPSTSRKKVTQSGFRLNSSWASRYTSCCFSDILDLLGSVPHILFATTVWVALCRRLSFRVKASTNVFAVLALTAMLAYCSTLGRSSAFVEQMAPCLNRGHSWVSRSPKCLARETGQLGDLTSYV